MKKICFFLILNVIMISIAFAQKDVDDDTGKETKPYSVWGLSLSSIQWNETLKFQQGLTFAEDESNYSGTIVTLQREVNHPTWGWSTGLFTGSGHAVGGGNASSITYQKSKVPFTVIGITPRLYKRISNRINLGISLNAFLKEITWPVSSQDLIIDSGRKMNATIMFDLNTRIYRSWDFYTGMGSLDEGATLWKIGVNYRF